MGGSRRGLRLFGQDSLVDPRSETRVQSGAPSPNVDKSRVLQQLPKIRFREDGQMLATTKNEIGEPSADAPPSVWPTGKPFGVIFQVLSHGFVGIGTSDSNSAAFS